MLRWGVVAVVVVGVGFLVERAGRPVAAREWRGAGGDRASVRGVVEELDARMAGEWARKGMVAAGEADRLAVARRVSLALHGAIPSLEEVGKLRGGHEGEVLERWVESRLADRRWEEYLAERIVRAIAGTEGGQFLIFRRDLLVDWVGQQLRVDRPWDEMVRSLVSEHGLWTGRPATNFITQAVAEDNLDKMKLAGRTVRAFLGQRMDCAQCHDHPFARWKQSEFEGLAAFFGGVKTSGIGIADGDEKLEVEDRKTLVKRKVEAAVPFSPELLPDAGTKRERLAGWLTAKGNRRFARAIANRVWGFMFGKPLKTPVDDLPDPPAGTRDVLDVLADDLVANRYSLRRLVRVIAGSRAFRAASTHSETDPQKLAKLEEAFAVFPLVRLRPEQVIGGMLQANSIKTVDRNANLLQRFVRFVREADFIKHYGDFGDTELDERGGTIPQRLLMLNGKMVRELCEAQPFGSPLRISAMATDDRECLEFTYLACLTRLPSDAERAAFEPQLAKLAGDEHHRMVEDLFWTLLNSTEFSWNH